MSPELRVMVPDRKEPAFRRAVSSIKGVQIVGRSPSEEEKERLSRERTERLQKFVASLKEPKPRKLQRKVNAAYRRLFDEVVGDPSRLTRPVGIKELKSIIVDNLEHQPTSWKHQPSYSQAVILVTRYGLLDGEFKSYAKAGKALGYSGAYVRRVVYNGERSFGVSISRANLIQRVDR